jgi:hypothetical protein
MQIYDTWDPYPEYESTPCGEKGLNDVDDVDDVDDILEESGMGGGFNRWDDGDRAGGELTAIGASVEVEGERSPLLRSRVILCSEWVWLHVVLMIRVVRHDVQHTWTLVMAG